MKRQDMFIQKKIISDKVSCSSRSRLKGLMLRANQIPLIYMGDKNLDSDPVLKYKPEKGNEPVLVAEAIHDEYVFMASLTGDKRDEELNMERLNVWVYLCHWMGAGGYEKITGLAAPNAIKELGFEQRPATFMSMIVDHEDMDFCAEWSGVLTEDVYNRNSLSLSPTNECEDYYELQSWKDPKTGGQFIESLTDVAMRVLRGVRGLNNYLKYEDKHLVEVLPAKPKKQRNTPLTKNRPWLNATGPHVLLLDRMPTTQREHQGGTHASPKPHRRRGHWKTLQHPKYRHHPQYQKKIYIKPSFVGPSETKYQGNIYRLVQPIEDS